MTGLTVAIIASAVFSHVIRYGQQHQRNMLWVGIANYWTATVMCSLFWLGSSPPQVHWENAAFGVLAGTALCAAYFLFNTAIRIAGVGVALTVSRLSVVLPVVASMAIWSEQPGLWRNAGLGLALLAIPLLTQGRGMVGAARQKAKALILLGNFLTIGIVGVAMKANAHTLPTGKPAFITFMFLTAAVGTQLVAWANTQRPAKQDILMGAALGAANVGSNYGIVHALASLPGTVVFPTFSAAAIVVTAVSAAVIWGERYTRLALLGMVIATAAVVLINI